LPGGLFSVYKLFSTYKT